VWVTRVADRYSLKPRDPGGVGNKLLGIGKPARTARDPPRTQTSRPIKQRVGLGVIIGRAE